MPARTGHAFITTPPTAARHPVLSLYWYRTPVHTVGDSPSFQTTDFAPLLAVSLLLALRRN